VKGRQRVTLKTIAERLGVSTSAVSRVLNGHARKYRISRKTEEAVLRVARELDFSPDQLARGLRLNSSATIGLVVPDISNPFFAGTARVVENEARARGYSVMLCDTQDSTDIEVESLALLESRKVEGLVILPVGQSSEHLRRYEDGALPVVIVDRSFPDLRLPCVASDNYGGSVRAVSYLIRRGHRVIACVQGLPQTAPNEDRVRGYRDALRKRGLPADGSLVAGDGFSEESGYRATVRLIRRRPDVTAIWALSSLIVLGTYRALAQAGLGVPEDVSVVGFDHPPWASCLSTPLTTVAQQNDRMGREAARMLFERIGAKRRMKPQRLTLPTKLIERRSVRTLETDATKGTGRSTARRRSATAG
jgi:LacI family transcriptional regulator